MARVAKVALLVLSACEPRIDEAAAQGRDAGTTAEIAAEVREPTGWRADRDASAAERERSAETRRPVVKALFDRAGLAFPPKELLLRAFKAEGALEVWANDKAGERLVRVARYRICQASGTPGPKRREGDWQVPEGFYRIAHFNAASRFHLSLQVSYPNESDRRLGDPHKPGGEIMIHGDCRSRGCLAMSDERIEELWIMARAAKAPIVVHLFPARDIAALIDSGERPEHHAFWRNLDQGKRLFERSGRPPAVRVDARGRYLFE